MDRNDLFFSVWLISLSDLLFLGYVQEQTLLVEDLSPLSVFRKSQCFIELVTGSGSCEVHPSLDLSLFFLLPHLGSESPMDTEGFGELLQQLNNACCRDEGISELPHVEQVYRRSSGRGGRLRSVPSRTSQETADVRGVSTAGEGALALGTRGRICSCFPALNLAAVCKIQMQARSSGIRERFINRSAVLLCPHLPGFSSLYLSDQAVSPCHRQRWSGEKGCRALPCRSVPVIFLLGFTDCWVINGSHSILVNVGPTQISVPSKPETAKWWAPFLRALGRNWWAVSDEKPSTWVVILSACQWPHRLLLKDLGNAVPASWL